MPQGATSGVSSTDSSGADNDNSLEASTLANPGAVSITTCSNSNSGTANVIVSDTSNLNNDNEQRYRPQKYCAVCGDKAIACNFNAVTCESCKAFFRRNAFKETRLKCLFDNKCLIDRVTRRFCSKCRLLKCFQIGMKREWILTDEQKQMKRVKIIQNRQSRTKRSQPDQFDASCAKSGDEDESIGAFSDDDSFNNGNIDKKSAQALKSDHKKRRKGHDRVTRDASTSCPDESDLAAGGIGSIHYCSLVSQCQYCSMQMDSFNASTHSLTGVTSSASNIQSNGNHQQQFSHQANSHQTHSQQQHPMHPNFSLGGNSQANNLAVNFQQLHPPPPYASMSAPANYQCLPYAPEQQHQTDSNSLRPPTSCCCMSLDGRHSQYHNMTNIHHHHPHANQIDQYNCSDQQLRNANCGTQSKHYVTPNLIQMTAQQVIVSSPQTHLTSSTPSLQNLHPMLTASPQASSHVEERTSAPNPAPEPSTVIKLNSTCSASNKSDISGLAFESAETHLQVKSTEDMVELCSNQTSGSSSANTSSTDENNGQVERRDIVKLLPEFRGIETRHVQWNGDVYSVPASTEAEVRGRIEKLDFNYNERQLIDEMIDATRFIFETRVNDDRKLSATLSDVVHLCDTALRRLIKTVKQIKAFRMLSMDDQIVLLKAACFKILLLRTLYHYQDEVEGWSDIKTGRVMRLDILKRAKKSLVYERHRDLVKKIPEPLRRDRFVLAVMSLTLLFDASINLRHSNSVGLDNLIYLSILRKYLVAVQPDPLTKYQALVESIQVINACNEEYNVFFSKDFQPEQVTPLLIEIFDISINNSV